MENGRSEREERITYGKLSGFKNGRLNKMQWASALRRHDMSEAKRVTNLIKTETTNCRNTASHIDDIVHSTHTFS